MTYKPHHHNHSTDCPLCKLPAGITIRGGGWVRLFCGPCRFSWTDRYAARSTDALRQRAKRPSDSGC